MFFTALRLDAGSRDTDRGLARKGHRALEFPPESVSLWLVSLFSVVETPWLVTPHAPKTHSVADLARGLVQLRISA